MGNSERLPHQLHSSNLIPKSNNWTSSPHEISPINHVSKKQPERMFKRVVVKNEPRVN